jgi:N-sulfoglucosamine sulfohydrolase
LSEERPNILFISVDDMSCDSVGAFGCELADTTPHIDRLATQGLRFEYAHMQVGNCMPCRNVMFSGRYPHNNRVEGFYQVKDVKYPSLADLMKAGGYFTGIRGKVSHSSPYLPFTWDLVLDNVTGEKAHPKNIESYYQSTTAGIAASVKAKKPFCLLINVSDPHKPFYGVVRGGRDPNKPSRVFTADEVPVPKFIPATPAVRSELAQYYSSVRRADDCVGAVLKALDESGLAERTVVFFLSDHGMPLPFAKTQLYHHSTRTPWIVRWPQVTQPDSIDKRHMISGVDLLPTLLDIAGLDHPKNLDGHSFEPLLRGQSQGGRELVFKEYNENAGGGRHPMRSVQSRRFGYIYNPWSDGERVFKTATTGTATYREMKRLAATDKNVAKRLELFDHRVREEFYDYENDPDALHNLIDDPQHQAEIAKMRGELLRWMKRTGDHALVTFEDRADEARIQKYMEGVEKASAARRANRRKRPKQRRQTNLISLAPGARATADKPFAVTIRHRLPEKLGEQLLHVTLKQGDTQQRIERQVVKISGEGKVVVTFKKTAQLKKSVRVAAFVGKDYAGNLQHINSQPIAVAEPN